MGRRHDRRIRVCGACEAIDALERAAFDLARVSVIGKDEPAPGREVGVALAGAHAKLWGQRAAFWNRFAETPAALALAWVPFIGHVVAVGPAASVLVGAQWRGDGGSSRNSALAKVLTLAGMSPGEVRTYEAAVRGGQILLLVHGAARDLARVRQLLDGSDGRRSSVIQAYGRSGTV